ncbi:ankyrin repeat domain-containing protein [Escherichia coli]|nr:ankyrin repeat domain-containing protein [Escherichia coli]
MANSSNMSILALIESNDIDKIRLLIDTNSSLIDTYDANESLLYFFVSNNKPEICSMLIENGMNVNVIDDSYLTPLVEAAYNGALDLVDLLLKNGAWVNGDPRGITTPLIEAIENEHFEVVKLLIINNADVNRLQTKFNRTPLDIATNCQNHKIVELLKNNGAKYSRETIDLETTPGSGILAHIYDNAGVIITDEYIKDDISIKTSLIGKGKQYINNKILFTFGNFVKKPCKEFLICLPYDWPINIQLLDGDYREAFPLKFLFLLSESYKNGMDIKEGSILEQQDIAWRQLKWPENIDALIAVDYSFDHQEKEQDLEGETVDLLLLVPIKYPKSGRPKEDKLNQWIIKRRTAKWDSVSFKNEWLFPV